MANCFLIYGSGYRHLVKPTKGILAALDLTVHVFDHPDPEPLDVAVRRRIDACDLVVALYGPAAPQDAQAAQWPHDEVLLACGMNKPIVMIVHDGVRVPESLARLQTPVRFNFWTGLVLPST